MIKSIKFELYKAFSQFKMIIFLVVMAAAPVLGAIGSLILKKTSEVSNNPELLKSLSFSNLEFPLQVLGGVSDLLIPIFIVILVADSIIEDYIKGTMKLSLISPTKRGKVLLSKIIAIAIEIAVLLSVLIVFSYISGAVFFKSTSEFSFGTLTLSLNEGILYTLSAYLLTFIVFVSFTCLVVSVALFFKSTGSIIAIMIGLLVATPLISLIGEGITKVLITNYFKFYHVLFLKWDSNTFYEGIFVISAYGIISFVLSYFFFKKKDLLY